MCVQPIVERQQRDLLRQEMMHVQQRQTDQEPAQVKPQQHIKEEHGHIEKVKKQKQLGQTQLLSRKKMRSRKKKIEVCFRDG